MGAISLLILLFACGPDDTTGTTGDTAASDTQDHDPVGDDTNTSAPDTDAVDTTQDQIALGSDLFDSACAHCHVQGHAPRMANVVPDMSDAQIARQIRNGGGGMPAIHSLDDDEIDAVIAYLRSEFGGPE